ncbi:hypothetical protein PIIN_02092 [Serendipita indica DSM 11827]|uniref:F-box domain-containing protein n=1 Tax=Serendipita indica (strain DSM 11827) TaxID=1109443 RepID=G4TA62_SERID|nr:hypothetical protein PIIN_02092 [Serendipita indica DSM 11827]
MAHSTFLSLPPEVCIQILILVSWKTLIHSKRVSKAFLRLLQSSPVEYQIRLGIAGYEQNNVDYEISVKERIELLDRIERPFRAAKFPSVVPIKLVMNAAFDGQCASCDLRDGFYVEGRASEEQGMELYTFGATVHRLPSALHPLGSSWILPDFKYPIRDFTSSPHNDLLVTVEETLPFNGEALTVLRFLSLSDGRPHPQSCAEFVLQGQLDGDIPAEFYVIIIIGDLVCLLAGRWYFTILNWKTGQSLVRWHDEVRDVIFLHNARFAILKTDQEIMELIVYSFDPRELGAVPPTPHAIYQLPALTRAPLYISCHCDPPPFGMYRNDNSISTVFTPLPFSPRLEDRALWINMVIQDPNLEDPVAYALIFRAETLLRDEVTGVTEWRDHIPVVSGSCWMHETYFGELPSDNYKPFFTYGSRMVYQQSQSNAGTTSRGLYLLDCNPSFVAMVQANSTTKSAFFDEFGPLDAGWVVKRSIRVSAGDIVSEDWVGDLPISWRKIEHSPVEYIVGSMMDGERIITVHSSDPTQPDDLTHISVHVR